MLTDRRRSLTLPCGLSVQGDIMREWLPDLAWAQNPTLHLWPCPRARRLAPTALHSNRPLMLTTDSNDDFHRVVNSLRTPSFLIIEHCGPLWACLCPHPEQLLCCSNSQREIKKTMRLQIELPAMCLMDPTDLLCRAPVVSLLNNG